MPLGGAASCQFNWCGSLFVSMKWPKSPSQRPARPYHFTALWSFGSVPSQFPGIERSFHNSRHDSPKDSKTPQPSKRNHHATTTTESNSRNDLSPPKISSSDILNSYCAATVITFHIFTPISLSPPSVSYFEISRSFNSKRPPQFQTDKMTNLPS